MKNKKYKDSGIPWIGMIPEDWEVCKVKHHYNFTTGFTPPSKNDQYYDENGIPWVTISELNGERYITRSTKGISKKYVEVFNPELVAKGSLLYSFKLSVGQVAITQIDLFTNEALAAFQDSDKICLEYLYYSSQYFIEKNANENIYGAKLLNQDLIKNAIILFPPLPMQQRIADFLDKKCSEIDELAALQETMIAELKRYKQSVITEAVTKGLDKNVKMKDSGVEWIGEIPEGWEVKRLKNLGYLYGGLTGKSGDDFNVDDESNCPYMLFIPFTNIFNNSVIDTGQLFKVRIEEGEVQNLVLKNDLLFLMSSEDYDGVGKPAIIEEQIDNLSLNSFCKGFRISNPTVCAKYLFYHISSHLIREFIRQEAKGFIRINLRQDKLACIPVFLPPLAEQQAIADFLDEKCGEIDELIAIKQQKIEQLKEYKKSVIFEYVTGKKEVKE